LIYNHPDAWAEPWKWATIHGAFLLAESLACIASWRLTEHQALHDSLTNLANRTLFLDRLEHALARGRRSAERIAVLFVDLNGFKAVNDSLGHTAGDRLLRAAARRLRGCVRVEDTVARLGGDKFVLLLEGTTDEDSARVIAERLLAHRDRGRSGGGRVRKPSRPMRRSSGRRLLC
jgi:GGDEF domain-containing protein